MSPSDPRPGIYRHYKGNEYVVTGVATHSETGERLVVYHNLKEPYTLWVRPLNMFCGHVLVAGEAVPRFALTVPI